MKKPILNSLIVLGFIFANSSFARDLKCYGEHFTNAAIVGGKIEGNCIGIIDGHELELEYEIKTAGIGYGASTRSKRAIVLELNPEMIKELKQEGALDLESCHGGSISAGYIGGVDYTKICARQYAGDKAKACINFSGALLYSGVALKFGASCEKFKLTFRP